MPTIVGVTVLELRLADSQSLKDKRQVVKSVTDRIKRRFNVSVTEIGTQDDIRTAALGVACVRETESQCRQTLNSVADFIYDSRPDAELMPHAIEILRVD